MNENTKYDKIDFSNPSVSDTELTIPPIPNPDITWRNPQYHSSNNSNILASEPKVIEDKTSVAIPSPTSGIVESSDKAVSASNIVPDTHVESTVNDEVNKQTDADANTDVPNKDTKKEDKKEKIAVHVKYGNRLIETLNLKSFNNSLYYYQDGVYDEVSDMDLTSVILKHINPSTEPAVCKKVLFYVRNITHTDERIVPNSRYVNFKNGLFDMDNKYFMPHTPEIFTLNQLPIDYNPSLPYNNEVHEYMASLANSVTKRELGMLQILGYLMTPKNNIQKLIIVYGPSASNGKSGFLKVIERGIGSKNVCHKSIEKLEQQFGADGMEYKLLNISTELPLTRIKDVSILKKSTSGDTFEASVKFEKNKTINSYIKHVFASNYLPNVADESEGYYRRLHIILLENKFNPATSQFDIDKFCSEENITYLFNWAFKEYMKMVNSGNLEFANSEESEKILENYRVENDSVLAFLTDDESVKTIYGCFIPRETMFNLYKSFCSLNEYAAIGKKTFYRELEDKYKFTRQVKDNGTKYCFYREQPVSKVKK